MGFSRKKKLDDVFAPMFFFRFCNFADPIYPIELEIKYTADTDKPASYLDLHVKIERESGG